MKIYISIPLKTRENLATFNNAINKLKDRGHKVIDVYTNANTEVTENVDSMVKMFKQMEKAIREADIVLVESTYPVRRSGFEMARAIEEKKPIIALYDSSQVSSTPGILLGNKSKYFSHREYNSNSIDQVIEEAIEDARKHLDTKFILIISPQIDKYLEWASQERRLHKAQIVRDAIEKQMEEDSEYQNFLEELE